jgi:hypothetical protein
MKRVFLHCTLLHPAACKLLHNVCLEWVMHAEIIGSF